MERVATTSVRHDASRVRLAPPMRSRSTIERQVVLLWLCFQRSVLQPSKGFSVSNSSTRPAHLFIHRYKVFASYSPKGVGCVVLLRDERFQLDASVAVAYLSASEAHGSKTGVVVHARRAGTAGPAGEPLALANVHLRHGDPVFKRSLLRSALAAVKPDTPCIVAGDFNTNQRQLVKHGLAEVLAERGLSRADTPEGVPMALRADLTWDGRQAIDHVYASAPFHLEVRLGPLPTSGTQGPWGPPAEHSGSDHAWLLADVAQSA